MWKADVENDSVWAKTWSDLSDELFLRGDRSVRPHTNALINIFAHDTSPDSPIRLAHLFAKLYAESRSVSGCDVATFVDYPFAALAKKKDAGEIVIGPDLLNALAQFAPSLAPAKLAKLKQVLSL